MSGLTWHQKGALIEMLEKGPESFSVLDRDVGNVNDPTMKVHLFDETPVERNYNRVPKPPRL